MRKNTVIALGLLLLAITIAGGIAVLRLYDLV